jgi:thiol-disulfide isomerase/thioredoxin
VIAVVFGGAVVLCRRIAGEPAARLLQGPGAKGDLSILGLLVGLFVLPFFVAPSLYSGKSAQDQLVIGQALEITGPTLDGGRFDLADHRGKVVLVDFWATWCRPCIEELPNVQAVYDEFHDQGLEVVSISLDEQRAALVRFLQARPLPWPQIFFDLTDEASLKNHPATRYEVQSIPCLLVIDRDGKLIARDVRGKEIRRTVTQALGLRTSWSDHLAASSTWLLQAVLYSIIASPLWLLLICGWGGAFVMTAAELAVRRIFQQPAAPGTAAG